MPRPGDVVTVDFTGATGIKRRPAVVVSSDEYHQNRPDVIVGAVTGQVQATTSPTDYVIKDWASAGLRKASAFRAYLGMARADSVKPIGRLTRDDWHGVLACMNRAIAREAYPPEDRNR